MVEAKKACDEWRAADEAARIEEKRLRGHWNEYFEGRAPIPPDELIKEVAQLQARADALLTVALTRMGPETKR